MESIVSIIQCAMLLKNTNLDWLKICSIRNVNYHFFKKMWPTLRCLDTVF